MENNSRKLVLAGGQVFYGEGFGSGADALCELVFNTAMVGYQEIAFDPNCAGQAVVMTYPLIGNYGMTDERDGARGALVGALIVRDYNAIPSNFRYAKTLSDIMEESGVPGLSGIDTRMLTRILRDGGARPCLLTDTATPMAACMARLAAFEPDRGAVARVGCTRRWYARTAKPHLNVAAIDCGLRPGLIRQLGALRANVTVLPHTVTAAEVLALRPDGLLLSSGPGDPKDLPQLVALTAQLRGRLPILGVGLGSQILALAYGADTYKMKLGHRGDNHPVRCLQSGRVEITAQSHGYAVDPDSLAGAGLSATHVSLLDGTVEGLCHPADQAWGVQYLPASGPLAGGEGGALEDFAARMLENQEKKGAARHA